MMDFSKVTALTIPKGNVSMITRKSDGATLWSTGALPSIYQRVEWVQAAHNIMAYIDLGFAFDKKATVEMEHWVMENNATAYPFGAVENNGILRCCVSSPYGGVLGTYIYGSDTSEYIVTTLHNVNYGKTVFVFRFAKGKLQGENITQGVISLGSTQQAEYTMTANLYLFGQNYNGSPRVGSVRRIGYFKYYDKNDTLICDLVPCYRKADGVIGMYDLIRKIFLTNVGTGTFTKGPDV